MTKPLYPVDASYNGIFLNLVLIILRWYLLHFTWLDVNKIRRKGVIKQLIT